MDAEMKQERRWGISSSTLKMIAVLTMLIDHIAAVLLVKILVQNKTWEIRDYNGTKMLTILSKEHMDMINLYQTMRDIGRIAFPIYCFVLVEGFMRTRNVKKYIGRMLLFAFLSEIPFDLAFSGKVFYLEYQNVMFTLFWGLVAMYICQYISTKTNRWYVIWPLMALSWMLCAGAAEWMSTDYGAKGVGCIFVLYCFRYIQSFQLIGGALAFTWEMPAPVSFLFIALYNGKKGADLRCFFYGFYPVHLLILYLISCILGMGSIAVI